MTYAILTSNGKFAKDMISGKVFTFATLEAARKFAASCNANNIASEKRTRYEARAI